MESLGKDETVTTPQTAVGSHNGPVSLNENHDKRTDSQLATEPPSGDPPDSPAIIEHVVVDRADSEVSTTSTLTSSSRESIRGRNKLIREMPTNAEVVAILEKFNKRFVQTFLRKKAKYENILRESGVNLDNNEDSVDANYDKTFEEEVEIIVSKEPENTVKCMSSPWRRSGNRKYNLRSLVRHIYVVVRRTKSARIMNKLSDISNEDLNEVLQSIASELSVAYQYQISVLLDDNEVSKAADHAVSCIMTHLKTKDAIFNPTEALQAVTEDSPNQYFPADQYLRTRITKTDSIKGKRRQRWAVNELFKQPGIRLPEAETEACKYYDCFTPYGFSCRPDKYGFRGPLHVWNEVEAKYTMIPNDVISCCSPRRCEVKFDSGNVHHTFVPVTKCQHFLEA